MKVTTFGKTAALGLTTSALVLGMFGAVAQADPPPAGFLAGAGSDTTQDVMQGVSAASGGFLESWHASVDGETHQDIVVKDTTVTRPNGSSEGRDALRRSRGTNVATPWATAPVPLGDDVFDYARSSSGPGGNADVNGQLVYVPFALDAVTVATASTSTVPAGITLANLQSLYSTGSAVIGGVTYTADTNIELLIPQSGSGTRSFWADAMGIDSDALPGWVHDTVGGEPVQEHDGTALVGNPDAIAPFSIAQHIAQTNGVAPDRRHGAVLQTVDGNEPTVVDDETGQDVLNPDFTTDLTREVYNIVDHADVTGADPVLQAAFNGASSEVCSSVTSGVSTIGLYGFGELDATTDHTCGEIATELRAFPNG